MKRKIIGLILNAILFVLWSIIGIGKVVSEPSWICLVYGGLMAIYLVTTINNVLYVVKFAKVRKFTDK